MNIASAIFRFAFKQDADATWIISKYQEVALFNSRADAEYFFERGEEFYGEFDYPPKLNGLKVDEEELILYRISFLTETYPVTDFDFE